MAAAMVMSMSSTWIGGSSWLWARRGRARAFDGSEDALPCPRSIGTRLLALSAERGRGKDHPPARCWSAPPTPGREAVDSPRAHSLAGGPATRLICPTRRFRAGQPVLGPPVALVVVGSSCRAVSGSPPHAVVKGGLGATPGSSRAPPIIAQPPAISAAPAGRPRQPDRRRRSRAHLALELHRHHGRARAAPALATAERRWV